MKTNPSSPWPLPEKQGSDETPPAVFLDRDGTINREVHHLSDPDQLELLPGAAEGLRELCRAGCQLVVVSNQSPIGRGLFTEARLLEINGRLSEMLAAEGVQIAGLVLVSACSLGGLFVPKTGPGHVFAGARGDGRYTGEFVGRWRPASRFVRWPASWSQNDSGGDRLWPRRIRFAGTIGVCRLLRPHAARGGRRDPPRRTRRHGGAVPTFASFVKVAALSPSDETTLLGFARDHLLASAETKRRYAESSAGELVTVGRWIAECFAAGGKLLLCGNGGSAADCQHIAAEFTSILTQTFNRRALPAIALTTDTSFLTARGNDYGFDSVFSRQVEALGKPGDVLMGTSTSGNSKNVLLAFETARRIGLKTVGLTGGTGGKMVEAVDLVCAFRPTLRRTFRNVILRWAMLSWRLSKSFCSTATAATSRSILKNLGENDGEVTGQADHGHGRRRLSGKPRRRATAGARLRPGVRRAQPRLRFGDGARHDSVVRTNIRPTLCFIWPVTSAASGPTRPSRPTSSTAI